MDANIPRIAGAPAVNRGQLTDRRRERRFVLPRREGDAEESEKREPSEEPPKVLEPQPRPQDPHVAVSRVRLDDEAGQQIDIQG